MTYTVYYTYPFYENCLGSVQEGPVEFSSFFSEQIIDHLESGVFHILGNVVIQFTMSMRFLQIITLK